MSMIFDKYGEAVSTIGGWRVGVKHHPRVGTVKLLYRQACEVCLILDAVARRMV